MTTVEFNHQLEKIEDKLFAFAMSLTRNREDAKDLVQETIMRALENLGSFKKGTNFKAWITTILRNSFINHYRKRKTRKKVETPIEECTQLVMKQSVRNEGDALVIMKELRQMLGQLSPEHRRAFVMFFRGYQYDEIAQQMNLPMGTVKSRIYYARKQLQKMIVTRYDEHLRRA